MTLETETHTRIDCTPSSILIEIRTTNGMPILRVVGIAALVAAVKQVCEVMETNVEEAIEATEIEPAKRNNFAPMGTMKTGKEVN